MEQFKTKDIVMNAILDRIIQEFENNKFNMTIKQFSRLITKIHESNPSYKHKYICNSITLNYQNYAVRNLSFHPNKRQWEQYLKYLEKRLAEIDSGKLKKVIDILIVCESQVTALNWAFKDNARLLTWFRNLCKHIHKLFNCLHKRISDATENIIDHIFSNIVQLGTLTMLIKKLLAEIESNSPIMLLEVRDFFIKRYRHIFDSIKKTLTENTSPEQNPGFIQWMDNSLDLIKELNANENNSERILNVRTSIEEVLCHAMSIAQISDEENHKKIRAGVHTVLQELKQLETEYGKSPVNSSLINLFIDIVSDKLCILEKRVNTAVLNISLKVFATSSDPVEELMKYIEEGIVNIEIKYVRDDFNCFIYKCDSHIELLTQVGLFAVACSTNKKVIAKINNNLANIEALGNEIISQISTFYTEQTCAKYHSVKFFADSWTEQVTQLRENVCSIIDPLALGQIVYEELTAKILNLIPQDLTKDITETLVKNVEMLVEVFDASVKDLKIQETDEIYKNFTNLQNVTREVRAASALLENKENLNPIVDKPEKDPKSRVLKRLLILKTMIERIIKSYATEHANSNESSETDIGMESKENSVITNTIPDYVDLTAIECRGLEILKNRSVLCKTLNKTSTKLKATKQNISQCLRTVTKSENRKFDVSFVRKDILKTRYETGNKSFEEMLDEITIMTNNIENEYSPRN